MDKTKNLLILLLCLFALPGAGQLSFTFKNDPERLVWADFDSSLKQSNLWNSTTISEQIQHAGRVIESNPDSALYLLFNAAKKSRVINWDTGVAVALSRIAKYYIVKGNFELAKTICQKALPYAQRGFTDKAMLANFYTICSHPYYHTNLDSMAYWAYNAEKELQNYVPTTMEQRLNVGRVFNSLAGLWDEMNDHQTGIRYAKRAIEVITPLMKDSSVAITAAKFYSNLALFYTRIENSDSAIHYYNKALSYNDKSIGALLGRAVLYINRQQYEQAVPLLKQAQKLADENGESQQIIAATFHLGQAYYYLRDPRSVELLEEVIAYAGKMGFHGYEVWDAYAILAKIYASRNDYAMAYSSQQKGIQLHDSFSRNKNRDAIMALEIKSQTARKDLELAHKQLALETKENRIRQQNIWIGALTGGALLTIALLIALYRSNLHKQKLQEETVNSMMQEQEISNLKAIMKGEERERTRLASELHDGIMVQLSTVLMSLDTLPKPYHHVESNEYFQSPYYRQIVAQLNNATRELRQTAHNLMPDMLLNGGIAEAIFYFCKAMEKSTGLNISFQQHGNLPRLKPEFEIAVYRIVQELMQNVLKHANATKTIVQLARPSDDMLTITVEDNGCGMTVNDVSETSGMGIKSIRTRIRALNGTMEILSSPEKGTTAYLEFDIVSVMVTSDEPLYAGDNH